MRRRASFPLCLVGQLTDIPGLDITNLDSNALMRSVIVWKFSTEHCGESNHS